ncbi:MAG: type II CAAX endopeptidase family protein [Acidobacteriota bacterium]
MLDALRPLSPFLLTALTVALLELRFRRHPEALPPAFGHPGRRALGLALVAFFLFAALFTPLAMAPSAAEVDVETLTPWQLFLLPFLLTVILLGWALLARQGGDWSDALRVLRLRERRWWRELRVGLVWGIFAWAFVLVASLLVAGLLQRFGWDALTNAGPPDLVVYLAGLPWVLRLAVSLSAGIFEETFFRGLLQPQLGVGLSTLFFVLAHIAYGSPVLLVGVTVLSLIYAYLARSRGSVVAAIVAHSLFDGIQLLVVIPAALAGADLVSSVGG